MHDVPSRDAGVRLDFLTQFRDDVAAGHPRTLAEYRERFPELGGWLVDEYPRLCAELLRDRSQAPTPDHAGTDDLTDDARLVEELEARRGESARYRRAGELGRGGTSRVFSVRDVELGRDVAMKVLQRDGASSLRRFLREARITSRLEHPGVLPVHELGLDAHGELYFTMRLVRGRSLKALFDELRDDPRRLRRRTAIEALLKVCDTMAFAHAHGVIHRDLKPSNVMLGDYGEVYVVDWGLARALESGDEPASVGGVDAGLDPVLGTLAGDVLGTPAYMPPEQASGDHERVGTASDVYSAGAMLYHLLAGRAPYLDGQSTPDSRAVLARVLDGPPPELALLAPEAPPELVAIARRAMAREPDQRYPTCAEMAADLRGFLEERIVRAHSSGPWVRATKWVRRNRALSAVLGVSLLLAIGATFGWSEARAKEADLALLATLRGPLELLQEFDSLWPLDETKRPALASWLTRMDSVREDVPRLEAMLADLRSRGEAQPRSEWIERKAIERAHTSLLAVNDAIERTKGMLLQAEKEALAGSGISPEGLKQRIASLELERRVVEARKPTGVWSFTDPQLQLLHDRLDQFLCEVDLAFGGARPSAYVLLVRAALERLDSRPTLDAEATNAAWDVARRAIAASPAYGGLDLAPQSSLVPLGSDPRSGLWEFADELTGIPPTRAADGTLRIGPHSSVVLVLIPGGQLDIGSQSSDPAGPCYDPDARWDEGPSMTTSLTPYLIGKHELTRAQWLRLTGTRWEELHAEPRTATEELCPAAGMRGSWASVVLSAYGFVLPSSARWEAAARGGSRTRWWTGDDAGSLRGAGNLADSCWLSSVGWDESALVGAAPFDDGEAGYAPIGAYRANGYGLYDTVGNVAEWCRDVTDIRQYNTLHPDNLLYTRRSGLQIVRGGSAHEGAPNARSAARFYLHPEYPSVSIGIRVARNVEPPQR